MRRFSPYDDPYADPFDPYAGAPEGPTPREFIEQERNPELAPATAPEALATRPRRIGPAEEPAIVRAPPAPPSPELQAVITNPNPARYVPRAEPRQGAIPGLPDRGPMPTVEGTGGPAPGFGGRLKNALKAAGHSFMTGRFLRAGGIQGVVDTVAGGFRGDTGDGSMGEYGDMVREQDVRRKIAERMALEQHDIERAKATAEIAKLNRAAQPEGMKPSTSYDSKAGAFMTFDPAAGARVVRPIDPATNEPYQPKEDPKYGKLEGTDAFYYYPENDPSQGARPIPGSPQPAAAQRAERTSELQMLPDDEEIEGMVRSQMLADPNWSPDAEIDNPDFEKTILPGAEQAALDAAIKDRRIEQWSPEEMEALRAIRDNPNLPDQERVRQVNEIKAAARRRQFEQFKSKEFSGIYDFYLDKQVTGKRKVRRGDTPQYKEEFRRRVDVERNRRQDKKRGILSGQQQSGSGVAKVDASAARKRLEQLGRTDILAEWDRIDRDPSITDKDAAKIEIGQRMLGNAK